MQEIEEKGKEKELLRKGGELISSQATHTVRRCEFNPNNIKTCPGDAIMMDKQTLT